jgi:hypothetical protein
MLTVQIFYDLEVYRQGKSFCVVRFDCMGQARFERG